MDDKDIETVIRHFIKNVDIGSVRVLGSGSINSTFMVSSDRGEYVVQSLNTSVFSGHLDGIEHNYRSFTRALDVARKTEDIWLSVPEWIFDSDGRYIWTDKDHTAWRVYPYIKGEQLKCCKDHDTIGIFARALADMHHILKHYPGRPETVIPDFHRLDMYYSSYTEARGLCDSSRRSKYCDKLIEENIQYVMENCISDADSVIHGDTKIDNVLYDSESGTVSFIDMDTFMTGSPLIDISDSVRSILCGSDENLDGITEESVDASVEVDLDGMERFIKGYYNACGRAPSEEEKRALMLTIIRMPFELSLRFYTDHIRGNSYFPVKRDGQNLIRAKKQFCIFEALKASGIL